MTILLKSGIVYTPDGFKKEDLFISKGHVFVRSLNSYNSDNADRIIDCSGRIIVPGFADVHVHLREPGFFYKETIASGTKAAAHGGYTAVCSMPNLNPVPSDMASLQKQLDIIQKDACIRVYPYGTITQKQDGRGCLSDMEEMAPYVCAFSDDGKGVQTSELMRDAMIKAKSLNKLIVAHCEDESLLEGGYIHKGIYAAEHGHKGICSESEWKPIERDIALAAETGCSYHVCHISTKESVALIRKAKAAGIDVTCETAPHYLVLCDENLQEDGKYKMNPPLRSRDDRDALIEGIADGTIDMIATDHAPHSAEEKSKGLAGSAFGIVGLETAFSVLYTSLVKTGLISLEKLIDLMSAAPRKRFRLEGGIIADNETADLTIIDPEEKYTIDTKDFLSKGKATPFEGMEVFGKVKATLVNGNIVWREKK